MGRSLDNLLSLPLPSTATIDMFVEQYRVADEQQRQNRQDQQDSQEELDRNGRDIDAIKKPVPLPLRRICLKPERVETKAGS